MFKTIFYKILVFSMEIYFTADDHQAVLFKLFSSWHTNNFWIWPRHTYFLTAKTYCYVTLDQTCYKFFVKAWNFRGALNSLSRHTKCSAAHSLGNPATKPSWVTATTSSAGWIAANRVTLLPLPPGKKQNVRCMTRRIGQKKRRVIFTLEAFFVVHLPRYQIFGNVYKYPLRHRFINFVQSAGSTITSVL